IPTQNSGYDFAVTEAGNDADLRIHLTNSVPFRPGFQCGLVLEAVNNSLVPQPGSQVSLYISPNLEFLSADPAPTSTAGDTIYWDLGTLYASQHALIYVHLQTPVGTSIGDLVTAYAAISPLNDAVPINNTALLLK